MTSYILFPIYEPRKGFEDHGPGNDNGEANNTTSSNASIDILSMPTDDATPGANISSRNIEVFPITTQHRDLQ